MQRKTSGEKPTASYYETENIRPYFEDELFLNRQRYPQTPEQSYGIVDEVAALARKGKHIALVDGSFDVPQPNHQWYLHHCRLLAASSHFIDKGKGVADPSTLAACDDVFFIVTLDTDQKLAALKGSRQDKGGVPRPVYPWELRAQYIANFMTPLGDNKFRPVVDLVTIDGSDKERSTPHESHLSFGAALLEKGALHSWLFYGEHDAKRLQADELIRLSGQSSSRTIGIVDHIDYCLDETGNSWQSTTIINKIRGT